MTKQELAYKVSQKTGQDLKVSIDTINAVMDIITETLYDGDDVFLRGFGTFTRKHRAEKKARNISKGTEVIIPEHDIAYFKPSFNLYERGIDTHTYVIM